MRTSYVLFRQQSLVEPKKIEYSEKLKENNQSRGEKGWSFHQKQNLLNRNLLEQNLRHIAN